MRVFDTFDKKILLILLFIFWVNSAVCAQEKAERKKILSIEEFILLATQHDTVFDEILIDQLKLNYRKDLNLPARDIVLSAKAQHDFYLTQDRDDPELSVSLSRLFPYIGTNLSLSYENVPSFSSTTSGSEFNVLISQPIAENAFGKTTRLKDKIIGIEIEVIRYQIVEAYEDYLAVLIATYYDWYFAYESMGIAENSYTQNLKLLDDMNERKKQSIALPIDVNKIKLLVLAKKEDVIALKEDYKNLTNLIEKAIWHDVRMELVPKDPSDYHTLDIKFENDYEKFTQNSRTYKILEKLEKQSSLEVKKVASDLLPSTNLLIGYKVEGDEWGINGENDLLYAGISLQWPFPNQVERAQYRVSKIEHKKTKLSNQNKYLELQANLKNLYLGIKREKELIKIAELKMNLAEDILKDEAENYSFGKVTLNDYIDAVNLYDQNKFNKITHTVQIKKLLVEWLRLTDSLVAESSVMR